MHYQDLMMSGPGKKEATLLPGRLFMHALSGTGEDEDDDENNDQRPDPEEIRRRIRLQHDLPTAGHLKVRKTVEKLVRNGQAWKGLCRDV
jgi:hypothetical protein